MGSAKESKGREIESGLQLKFPPDNSPPLSQNVGEIEEE